MTESKKMNYYCFVCQSMNLFGCGYSLPISVAFEAPNDQAAIDICREFLETFRAGYYPNSGELLGESYETLATLSDGVLYPDINLKLLGIK